MGKIGEDNLGGQLGHGGARAHGDTGLGLLEGGGMLDALLLALRLQVHQVDSLCGLQDGAGLLF